MHVDIALLRAAPDRAVEIELLGRALPCEAAQAPERNLHVAGPELLRAGEILEVAPVPDFHGAAVAALLLPDPHAFGIVAIGPEGRGPRRADPFGAALM